MTLAAPGAMATNPEICERIEKQGFFGRLTLKSTSKIARKCVDGTLRGKRQIVFTPISYVLSRFFPERWRIPLLSLVVKREL